MRSLLSLLLAFVVATSALLLSGGSVADAAFHCMRIHAVVGGFNGDNNIQYVELRMNLGGQTLISGHAIQFFDATGTLKATFTFPSGITNGSTGDSILVGTSEFNSNVTGGASNFTFTGANTVGANGGDALHPVQVPGGTVVFAGAGTDFNCLLGPPPVDSVAYGGATAMFGTAAVALPNPGTALALRLSNLNTTPMNNSTEYALTAVSTTTFSVVLANLATDFTTPRNNSRTVLRLGPAPVPGVGGVAEEARVAALPVVADGSGDSSSRMYLIGGAAFGALIVLASGWYVYRRRVA